MVIVIVTKIRGLFLVPILLSIMNILILIYFDNLSIHRVWIIVLRDKLALLSESHLD